MYSTFLNSDHAPWCAVLIATLTCMGCDKSTSNTSAPSKPAPKAQSTTPPPQSLSRTTETAYKGEGALKLGPIEQVARDGALSYEKQLWKFKHYEGVAWRVKVPRDKARLEVVAQDALSEFETFLPKGDGSWAAINGGFYEKKSLGGYQPMGVVIANGKMHRKYTYRGGSGLLAVRKNHDISLIHRDDWKAQRGEDWLHVLQSIDRVVANKKVLVKEKPDARAATRSGVILGEKFVWLIALAARPSVYPNKQGAQLRKTSYLGMPLWAFAKYIKQTTDVVDALNLDGSVSTHFAVQAATHRTHIQGVRGVFNAVILKAREH